MRDLPPRQRQRSKFQDELAPFSNFVSTSMRDGRKPASLLSGSFCGLADFLIENIDQCRDWMPILLRGVSIAQRHGLILHRLMIDRHSEWSPDLILSPIAP